ncbi:unnamed protein product [Brassica napus]|nr:unnamed protein product [Brassica napus]
MNSLAQPRHKTLRRLTSNKFISIIKIGGEEDNEWLQSLLRVAECDSIMLKSLIREEIPQAFKAEEGKKLATEMAYMVPGILQEPCFSEQRLDLTKPISLVYIIDDIFDVYGELDELTIFTQVVESGLICSERSWSKQNGLIRVTYQILRSNGFVSSGVHLVMLHLLGEEITTGKVELIESIPKIVSSAATILRLWDDLGSAKDENQDGIDESYIECYLNEHKGSTGSTVDEARTHVFQKISKVWKLLNRDCLNPCSFSRAFTKACLNIARTVPLMYSYDDDQQLPRLNEYLKRLTQKCSF